MYFLETILTVIGGIGVLGLISMFFNEFDISMLLISVFLIAVGLIGLSFI